MIQNGMRQYGNTACLQDDFHSPHGCDLFPWNKAGGVVTNIAVKGLLQAFNITVGKQISGVMGSGNDTARKFCNQFFISNGNSMLLKPPAHFLIPHDPAIDKVYQPSLKEVTLIVQIQAYDVDIPSLIFRRKFDAGNYFNGLACRSRNGFINTGGGVVICQSKGRKSLFYGMFNQFGRGIAAIGFGGMYM